MSDWAERAARAVAGFSSTRSKVPEVAFGGPGGPSHFVSALGARVETSDGRILLDWSMALGAAGLGYSEPRVTGAVATALASGAVGPLAPTLEVRVAERLVAAYPGAEMARFFKTGAEAVQAAVRIARLATGRTAVVHCGYHGWLDGPTRGPGVPGTSSGLWREVPFGSVADLEAAVSSVEPAALVLEPVIEREPPADWLRRARELASGRGAVLVFDEMKTGFRLARGGAAERWGVTPDLAVLGKALANGLPLAALLGRADLMAEIGRTWISSTAATETTALAAAEAVMDVWDEMDVAGHISAIGRKVTDGLRGACAAANVALEGLPEMWFLRFGDVEPERRFLLDCVGRGVLLKRGAYCFPSLAHTEDDVQLTRTAVEASLSGLVG